MPRLLRYYFITVPFYLLALACLLSALEPMTDAARYAWPDEQNALRALDTTCLTLPAEDCVALLMHSAKPHVVKNIVHQARVKLQQTRLQANEHVMMHSFVTAARTVLPHSFTIPKQHYVYALMRMLC